MNTNKTLYGLLAFGPLVLIFLSMFILFGGIAATGGFEDRYGGPPEGFIGFMMAFFVLIMIGSLLSIASMIMFIIHISKNKLVPEDQRIMWIVGVVLANGITNIIYFFMYITREEKLQAEQDARMQQFGKPNSPWD